ncbi:hypothetical protein Pint_22305 [Pistacia integerrima]|uniref:Uncharacterized protein n=1 Tax=Pistacia integerrima TaxID=434235 RepID=A0ACC0YI11_9ROSI|nr:hypothetical protein Pint_22305 [Pistacia integerrima]
MMSSAADLTTFPMSALKRYRVSIYMKVTGEILMRFLKLQRR